MQYTKKRFAKADIMKTKEPNLQSRGNDTLGASDPSALRTPNSNFLDFSCETLGGQTFLMGTNPSGNTPAFISSLVSV